MLDMAGFILAAHWRALTGMVLALSLRHKLT